LLALVVLIASGVLFSLGLSGRAAVAWGHGIWASLFFWWVSQINKTAKTVIAEIAIFSRMKGKYFFINAMSFLLLMIAQKHGEFDDVKQGF